MKTYIRYVYLAALMLVAASAVAQAVSTTGAMRVTTKTVTKTSAVVVTATANRHKWCAEVVSATGAAVTDAIWLTGSTTGGVTQTARVTNASVVLGGSNPLAFCDDGDNGGIVYNGAITVIALGTTSAPQVKLTEWRQ